MSTYDRLISVDKRILLHLLSYNNPRDQYNICPALTQEGIAKATGVDRGYTSIIVNKLITKGFIKEDIGHIRYGKRRQKYFLLTPKGKKFSQELKKELSNEQIELTHLNGKSETIALGNIMFYLNEETIFSNITDQDIYSVVSKDKILNIEQLKNIGKKRFIDFSADAPTITNFYGRKREIATLKKWIDDKDGNNIIYIYGFAGIGKTTLVAKFIENYRQSKHLFWHSFHDLDTLQGILFKLAEFLSKLGSNHLELYLRAHTKLDQYEVSRILGENIGIINAVLIFDDFHKSNAEIKSFFTYFFKMLKPPSNTKMVILTREVIAFYNLGDISVRKIVAELELRGLGFESSKKLLKERDINDKRIKEIYQLTAGNPLFLEIFDSKDHVEKYIHNELFSNLAKAEEEILEFLSIYRFPVPEDFLVVNEDFNFERLYNLIQKSIVKRDDYDRYFIHDLISQFFYIRISPSKRKKFHLFAAQCYEERGESKDHIEAIYHYQKVGQYEKASQLAIESSRSIIAAGCVKELLAILEKFNKKNLDIKTQAEIQIVKGKASLKCGELKKALLNLHQSADIATMIGDNELKVNAICETGHILEEQNQFDKAMECFKRCLDISKDIGFYTGIGRAYRGIGRVHWRKEEYERAISSYKKCLDIPDSRVHSELMASIYIDMGNVYDEMNYIEKSIESYNKAIEILNMVEDPHELARAYGNLAITFQHQERFEKAIEYNIKQLTISQNLRDIKLIGYGLAEMGYCYSRIGEFKKAKEYVAKAKEIALKIGNDNIMNILNKANGIICRHEGRTKEGVSYLKKSIEYLKTIGATYQLPDSHFELGLLYEEIGDSSNAKKHFNMAANLYNKIRPEKADLIYDKLSKF